MTLPAWARPLSTPLLAGFILLVPLENSLTSLRHGLLWAAAIALVWESRSAFGAGGPPRRRWWALRLAGGAGAALALAGAATLIFRARGGADWADIPLDATRHLIPLTLLAPFLVRLYRRRFDGRRAALALGAAVGLWTAWITLASCWSPDPAESFDLLYDEAGAFALAWCLLILKLDGAGPAARRWVRWLTLTGGVAAVAAIAMFALGHLGGEVWLDRLLDREFLRVGNNELNVPILRAQYPFESHNRLASFMLIVALLGPLAAAGSRAHRSAAAWVACAGLAAIAVFLSGTRGGMIALAGGVAILIASRLRWLAAALPLALLGYVLLPSDMKGHVRTIIDPQTYREREGNVGFRVRAWQIAGRMIAERPVGGIGFGWKNFEVEYERIRPDDSTYDPDVPHAHNNFLEIAVETGLPGLALFLAIQFLLLAGLVRAMAGAPRGSPRRAAAWAGLALMAGIHLYGMTNYSLRRNVGFEVWMAFAVVQAAAAGWLTERTGNAEESAHTARER